MKNVIKVFIILGMIGNAILIFPIIFGIKALKELERVTKPEELKTTAILTLLFVNLIAGVLMLVIKESDLAVNVKDNIEHKNTAEYNESNSVSKTDINS